MTIRSLRKCVAAWYPARASADQNPSSDCVLSLLFAPVCRFRNRVLEQLAAGSYQPVLDDGLKHCLAVLPWWAQGQQLALQLQQTTVAAAAASTSASAVHLESALGRSGLSDRAHRRHARAHVWLKRQKHRSLEGPGKLAR
jgi:hypothetical protein